MAIRKGILIGTLPYVIEKEITYDDSVKIEGMYYKVDGKDIIPIAYIFPIENRDKVQLLLDEMTESKKKHDDLVARVYYKDFPKLR